MRDTSTNVATTVMVVDDEHPQRELLRRWLERWGFAVRLATDARDAVGAMLTQPADILLVDIQMPGEDGLWLVERVRTTWPRPAIIVVSGVLEFDVAKKAQHLGVIDFVTKPFGRESLRLALNRAMAALQTGDE